MFERKEEEKGRRFEREKQLSSSDSELAFVVDIDATNSRSSNSSSNFGEELSNLVHENRNMKPTSTIALEAKRFDVSNRAAPVSWSSGNAFVSGAGDLGFKPRAGQIGHSVANGSTPLRHFFEMSCVVRAQ